MADSLYLLKRRLQSWQDYPASGRMAATRERAIAELTREIEAMEATCRRCGGEMQPGIAMGQTYTAGAPDFPGDHHGSTMSAGGPGVVIEARKCVDCGHSITFGSLNNDSMVIE